MDSLQFGLFHASSLSVLLAVLIIAGLALSAIAASRDQFPGRRQGGGTYVQPPDYPDETDD